MPTRPKGRHCETCTCGLTRVEWSDRSGWVDLSDPESIADIVEFCVFDHYYDRTEDGIPYGMETVRPLLAPVVEEYLSQVEPDWKNKTVSSYDRPQWKAEFRAALMAAVRP